jgi:hypothetical protein
MGLNVKYLFKRGDTFFFNIDIPETQYNLEKMNTS